jgi:signal peptidase I
MLLKAIVGVAVLILGVAIFAGRPHFKRYRIPSASMEPTIHQGETVTLNGGEELKPGDIVILNPPRGAEEFDQMCGEAPVEGQPCAKASGGRGTQKFIKRIVAGPGDEIALEHGRAVVNGKPQKEPYVAACGEGPDCDFPRPITVPEATYFMLGDNRGASDDSRFWGPVPEDWILGRVERCSAIYFFCSPA